MKSGQTIKNIFLRILLPISIILIVLSVFLNVSCGKSGGDKPNQPAVTITQNTINEKSDYKVTAESEIWYNNGDDDKITLGHDLFNLKALSIDHSNTTNFIISGNVNFGFLVDFDMDCHLTGVDDELMSWSGEGNGCGVIVGNIRQPLSAVSYSKNMYIGKMVFTISCDNSVSGTASAYGVYINDTITNSTQTIGGVFAISSPHSAAYGVRVGSINSNLNINGVFSIHCNTGAGGVQFSGPITTNNLVINGTFTLYSDDGIAFGIDFMSTTNGPIKINGVFTLYAHSCRCINFASYTNSDIVVNGFFYAWSNNHNIPRSIYFNSDMNGTLSMTSTNFFSIESDDGNIFTKISGWTGSYKWNGYNMTNESHVSVGDSALTLKGISDNDAHLTVRVIDTCGNTPPFNQSKSTFNNAYKNALQNYLGDGDCPTIAKSWLENIISKITL